MKKMERSTFAALILFAIVATVVSANPLDESGRLASSRERRERSDEWQSYPERQYKSEISNMIRGPNSWSQANAMPKEAPAEGPVEEGVFEPDNEKLKAIAFNGREIKVVGPNQKEVEVKNDFGSKMLIALDNLQKEATEVFEEVGDKLEKGWVDLRKMLTPKKSN